MVAAWVWFNFVPDTVHWARYAGRNQVVLASSGAYKHRFIMTKQESSVVRVGNGREFLAMPGPTTIPDRVLSAMHRPAIDIYSGELIDITMSCLEDIRRVFRSDGHTYIYAANGHGAWEAALTNCLCKGDRIVVADCGMFAAMWGEMAQKLGLDPEILQGPIDRAFDPDALEERLRADTCQEIKAVLIVQVDTASGAMNDIAAIRKAIDNAGHDALLMVDVIASLACVPFEMDEWGVDVAVGGSQKGLMTPPGLGFVAAGERALSSHQTADLVTRYWDWTFREGKVHYMKHCGTAPEHLLFGLREALDMLAEEGLGAVHDRHRLLADTVRTAVSRWSEDGPLSFNVREPDHRSNSITTVLTGDQEPGGLLEFCRDRCGVVVGIGIGPDLSDKAFRIAHMGHVNAPMILGTLSSMEVALTALGIPHGSGGVSAASAQLGKVLGADQ